MTENINLLTLTQQLRSRHDRYSLATYDERHFLFGNFDKLPRSIALLLSKTLTNTENHGLLCLHNNHENDVLLMTTASGH